MKTKDTKQIFLSAFFFKPKVFKLKHDDRFCNLLKKII